MENIQFIQTSPTELADLINEKVKTNLESLIKELSINDKQGSEFLTRKETAKFFGASLVTLHDWTKKGLITPYKMGNRVYYKRSELIGSLLESNRRK